MPGGVSDKEDYGRRRLECADEDEGEKRTSFEERKRKTGFPFAFHSFFRTFAPKLLKVKSEKCIICYLRIVNRK